MGSSIIIAGLNTIEKFIYDENENSENAVVQPEMIYRHDRNTQYSIVFDSKILASSNSNLSVSSFFLLINVLIMHFLC